MRAPQAWASGVRFGHSHDQARPRASGFHGEHRIVSLWVYVDCGDAVAIGGPHSHSGPVTVGTVKALAMAPGIGGVRGDQVNPLRRIQRKQGGVRAWVRGCFQGHAVVLQFSQRVHDRGGTGDMAGLRLHQGRYPNFDRWSDKD
jgi:hypothetical protein